MYKLRYKLRFFGKSYKGTYVIRVKEKKTHTYTQSVKNKGGNSMVNIFTFCTKRNVLIIKLYPPKVPRTGTFSKRKG